MLRGGVGKAATNARKQVRSSSLSKNLAHFFCQSSLDKFGTSFTAGDAADIRRINTQLPGNAVIETSKQ